MMAAIISCLIGFGAFFAVVLLLIRGGHSRGKSSEVLDRETDDQLQRLRERGGL